MVTSPVPPPPRALKASRSAKALKKLTLTELVRWFDWLEAELDAANIRMWSIEMDYAAKARRQALR